MEKNELLKSIGFSDSFIKHLEEFDKKIIDGNQFESDSIISYNCDDFSTFENTETSGSELYIRS